LNRFEGPGTPADRRLRVLFSMRNFWYVRIFEAVIRELAARGHAVHILAEQGGGKALERDLDAHPARKQREKEDR